MFNTVNELIPSWKTTSKGSDSYWMFTFTITDPGNMVLYFDNDAYAVVPPKRLILAGLKKVSTVSVKLTLTEVWIDKIALLLGSLPIATKSKYCVF